MDQPYHSDILALDLLLASSKTSVELKLVYQTIIIVIIILILCCWDIIIL